MKSTKILSYILSIVCLSIPLAATSTVVSDSKESIMFFSFSINKNENHIKDHNCEGLAAAVEQAAEGWKKLDVQGIEGAMVRLGFDHGASCLQTQGRRTIQKGEPQTVEEGGFFVAFKTGNTNHSPAFSLVEAGKIYTLSTIKPHAGLKKFIGISGDAGLQVEVSDDPNYQPPAEDENAEAAEGEGKEVAEGEKEAE